MLHNCLFLEAHPLRRRSHRHSTANLRLYETVLDPDSTSINFLPTHTAAWSPQYTPPTPSDATHTENDHQATT
jgi:hypothetical protein